MIGDEVKGTVGLKSRKTTWDIGRSLDFILSALESTKEEG
jgi:hypothetical protein